MMALDHLEEARVLMKSAPRSRELSVAITELETSMLWLKESIHLQNLEHLARGEQGA